VRAAADAWIAAGLNEVQRFHSHTPNSSLRAKRSNPLCREGRMDCRVASLLAMTVTQTHLHILAARFARAVANSFAPNEGAGECRVRAAPAVSCAKLCEKHAHEHTGSAETLRHPPRNGFTAYAVLTPATNSSCHRHRRIKGCLSPVEPTRLRRFSTSNGCQVHTVLPYAATRLRQKASPGFGVVRLARLGIAHEVQPALRSLARPTLPRPPHLNPRS
jgi:hypothetical protein